MSAPEVARSTDESHFAFVRCQGDSIPGQQPCGLVGLTREQYSHQMNRSDSGWFCPNCGSSAAYDDAASEEAQGVNDMDDSPLKDSAEEADLW